MKSQKLSFCKKGLLVIWMTVFVIQLGLAIAWAVMNLNTTQEFYETGIYVNSLIERTNDGWHLPGYSVMMLVIRKCFGFVKERYVLGIYAIQILFSWFCLTEAVRSLIKVFARRNLSYKYAVWAGLYILTIPMVWQMQLAILPDAMCLAATVILFAKLLELNQDSKVFRWDCFYVMAGALLLTGTFHRYYFYGCTMLVAAFWLINVLRRIFKAKEVNANWKTSLFMPLILTITIVVSCLYPFTIGISGQYPSYSLTADIMRRTVVPYLTETSKHYDDSLKEHVTRQMIKEHENSEIGFYTFIAPEIEEKLGDESKTVYQKMIHKSILINGKSIAKDLAKELAAYVATPVSFVKYIYNSGNSRFGYNLTRMLGKSPILTLRYMMFGTNGMSLIVLLSMMLGLAESILSKKAGKSLLYKVGIMLMSLILVTVPQMLFATNRTDYRIGLFALLVWLLGAVSLIVKEFAKKENGNG